MNGPITTPAARAAERNPDAPTPTPAPRGQVESADALHELLLHLNDSGEHPVVLLVDREGVPGLAYLAEFGGDEVHPYVLTDGWSEGNDHDQELHQRYYPATILWRPDAPTPTPAEHAEDCSWRVMPAPGEEPCDGSCTEPTSAAAARREATVARRTPCRCSRCRLAVGVDDVTFRPGATRREGDRT